MSSTWKPRILSVIGKSEKIIVSRFNQPYEVKAGGDRPGMGQAILGMYSWFMSKLDGRENDARVAVNIRAPNQIRVHLLDKKQLIAAGRRALVLAWRAASQDDGRAILITMTSEVNKATVLKATVKGSIWMSPQLDLEPGRYTIRLQPATGKAVTGSIEAIDQSMVPRPAWQRNEAVLPAELGTTMTAAWLASNAGGIYQLEALQLLMPIADEFEPAARLRDALIDGAWTKQPAP